MSACEGVNRCYNLLDQDANLPLFSFYRRVCSYRFLQERLQMIPTQKQQRLVEKAV